MTSFACSYGGAFLEQFGLIFRTSPSLSPFKADLESLYRLCSPLPDVFRSRLLPQAQTTLFSRKFLSMFKESLYAFIIHMYVLQHSLKQGHLYSVEKGRFHSRKGHISPWYKSGGRLALCMEQECHNLIGYKIQLKI